MDHYFRKSRGLLYSYLICIPLLLLYEVLILISQPQSDVARISVDVWFKNLFAYFGLDAISTTLLVAAMIGGVIVYHKRKEVSSIKRSYFLFMIAESAIYAIAVAIIVSNLVEFILLQSSNAPQLGDLNRLQLIALSLGAGLYEELFFRVILVSVLVYLFNLIFARKNFVFGAAVVTAAVLFSGVHYVGEYADIFTLNSFLFRFLFGLALNLIYVIRGFGMAAWTHALYDLIVVLNL